MSKHSEEDIAEGLKALVLHAGDTGAASRKTGIAPQTLYRWRTDLYRERYETLREAHEQTVDRELGEDLLNITRKAVSAIDQTLDRYNNALKANNYKAMAALGKASKEMATVAGIGNQNSRIIRDKPTEISESRYDLRLIERLIQDAQDVIEGEAEEIPPRSELEQG